MKKLEIDVLSDETNASVVRMPGRRFPGLVVPGDKLIYLNAKAKELHEAASESTHARVTRLAANLCYEIKELLEAYAIGCRDQNNTP